MPYKQMDENTIISWRVVVKMDVNMCFFKVEVCFVCFLLGCLLMNVVNFGMLSFKSCRYS